MIFSALDFFKPDSEVQAERTSFVEVVLMFSIGIILCPWIWVQQAEESWDYGTSVSPADLLGFICFTAIGALMFLAVYTSWKKGRLAPKTP